MAPRLVKAEDLVPGDIALKLQDGRLCLVGSGGFWIKPTWWERFVMWLRGVR